MAINISERAKDRGTFIVDVSFTDDAAGNDPVTPTAVSWTLTDRDKTPINSREDVAVPSGDLATTVEIVLTGDDLDHDDGSTRRLIITATYDSAAGIGLSSREVALFSITDID